MATDIATLSQLLEASLDPRRNKEGKSLSYLLVYTSTATPQTWSQNSIPTKTCGIPVQLQDR